MQCSPRTNCTKSTMQPWPQRTNSKTWAPSVRLARNHPNTSSFAVARHQRSARNMFRLAKLAWVHGRLRSSTRMRMLQDTKATICKNTDNANVTIWMEEHLTMRHIRLALEDNCTSCTRHPNLTLDGGAHSLTPALEPDFTTCCL